MNYSVLYLWKHKLLNNMILGSHNSISFSVPQWYMCPFFWIAKCQSLDISRQAQCGAVIFDFRVRFDDSGVPYFCHGLMQYKGENVNDVLTALNAMFSGRGAKVRLVLETKKADPRQEDLFREFCKKCEDDYESLEFFEGTRKFDWKVVYAFKTGYDLEQMVGSMQGLSWWPWLYARLHNKKNMEMAAGKDGIFLFDFIK